MKFNVKHQAWISIALLIFAGEMIFSLPFHVARFFRPTMLEVFSLTNAELGDIFAAYGIVAMLCYFPGGALADRFSPKNLMTFSLAATALGGFYFAQHPNESELFILYIYWGATSILLFWSAMLKATRQWGGNDRQGSTFGLLDAGRGLVAALAATLATTLFSLFLSSPSELIDNEQRAQAFNIVIYFYSVTTLISGVLVYLFLPEENYQATKGPLWHSLKVLKKKTIWLQAIIIVCAYCGFKGVDNYSLYAVKLLKFNEIEAAQFMSYSAYLRPIAAIIFGFLADRFTSSRLVFLGFVLAALGYAFLSVITPQTAWLTIIIINMLITLIAVFGIRGIYFALTHESGVPHHNTGVAVGFVSLLGFTPDVFFYSITGRILDGSQSMQGFQVYFILLCGIAIIGALATGLLYFINARRKVW